jgi:transcriptional regulator with GAF, ATPase, and Fis domain
MNPSTTISYLSFLRKCNTKNFAFCFGVALLFGAQVWGNTTSSKISDSVEAVKNEMTAIKSMVALNTEIDKKQSEDIKTNKEAIEDLKRRMEEMEKDKKQEEKGDKVDSGAYLFVKNNYA